VVENVMDQEVHDLWIGQYGYPSVPIGNAFLRSAFRMAEETLFIIDLVWIQGV
jgi:hypothetical protein